MTGRPRIYLAGPEVFLPDAAAVGAEKCRLAAAAGLQGVFPLDAALDLSGLGKGEQARRISLANEGLMRSCDALVANITPFRGASMDAGTAFEVGFMRALGRPVGAYSNCAQPYAARARAQRAIGAIAGDCDRPDVAVEDFDLAENLMVEVAVRECGLEVARHEAAGDMRDMTGFLRALADMQRLLSERASPHGRG